MPGRRHSTPWRRYLARLAEYTPIEAKRGPDIPDSPLTLWSHNRVGLLIESPAWLAARRLGLWAEVWYQARRDADLLGKCPVCRVRGEVVDASDPSLMHGIMRHASDCPISATGFRRLRGETFKVARA
jgi:hypothetical protein